MEQQAWISMVVRRQCINRLWIVERFKRIIVIASALFFCIFFSELFQCVFNNRTLSRRSTLTGDVLFISFQGLTCKEWTPVLRG